MKVMMTMVVQVQMTMAVRVPQLFYMSVETPPSKVRLGYSIIMPAVRMTKMIMMALQGS